MPRRLALVIDNSAYVHVGELRNPSHDAKASAAVLAELGFEVTSGIDLDRDEMENIIDAFEPASTGSPSPTPASKALDKFLSV